MDVRTGGEGGLSRVGKALAMILETNQHNDQEPVGNERFIEEVPA